MLEGADYSSSDLALEKVQTRYKSPVEYLLAQENDNFLNKVNTKQRLSRPIENRFSTENKFSWDLLIGILAGVGLILLFIFI